MNTFGYLPVHSNHPNFIIKNIPKSLFIRIRRICSKFSDYLYFSRLFIFQLMSRGYSFNKLRSISNTVANINRDELIPYKEKNNNFIKNKIYFCFQFDKNVSNIKQIILKSWENTIKTHPIFKNLELVVINSMQQNLSSILLHNFRFPKSNLYNFIKCENANCKTCFYASSDQFLNLNNFFLPFNNVSNCKSTNSIYIILCEL